jgi:SAM-dependent methyltransferase
MEAKELYELRNERSLRGRIMRALVHLHKNGRPSRWYPRAVRNEPPMQDRLFQQHLGGQGDVLLLGSNLPPEALGGLRSGRVTQVDRKEFPHVNLVADAEELTRVIAPNSYDYVVCTSMLEHTPHPWKVVSEVFKVLRPKGIFYLTVPWMFPLHLEPMDFWRFSIPGLKTLVGEAGFIELESGSAGSPHEAMSVLLQAYLCEVGSFDRSAIHYSLEFLTSWLLYPLGRLEALRLGPRKNYYTNAMFYFVAQKP